MPTDFEKGIWSENNYSLLAVKIISIKPCKVDDVKKSMKKVIQKFCEIINKNTSQILKICEKSKPNIE